MILKWITRIYVLITLPIVVGFTGLFIENFNKKLYVFIFVLIGAYIALAVLWYCSNIHQTVIFESKIKKSLYLKIKIGWVLGLMAAISPVVVEPTMIIVIAPHIVIASVLVLYYVLGWRKLSCE